MQNIFESSVMPESYDSILEKTKTFLAGFHSVAEKDGVPVKVYKFPEDWTASGSDADRGKGLFD